MRKTSFKGFLINNNIRQVEAGASSSEGEHLLHNYWLLTDRGLTPPFAKDFFTRNIIVDPNLLNKMTISNMPRKANAAANILYLSKRERSPNK